MKNSELLKAFETGYKILSRKETLEEKSFRSGCLYASNEMYHILKKDELEIEKLQKENEELKDFNKKLQAAKDRLDKCDRENQLKIDKATGIANERINYCYQKNDKEQLESWQEMFDTLQGSDKK